VGWLSLIKHAAATSNNKLRSGCIQEAGGGGASALVGGVWVGAEDALQVVEAQADGGGGGRGPDLRLRLRVAVALFEEEEALLAQGLPGRRRAGGGLLEVADSAPRRLPAAAGVIVAVVVVLGAGGRQGGGGGGGLVELGRRRHAQLPPGSEPGGGCWAELLELDLSLSKQFSSF